MKNIIFTLTLLTAFTSLSQSLSGNLKSEKSKESLGYGNVDIYQEDVLIASVLTDAEGNYKVSLDTGEYRCVINYAGHKPIEKKVHIVEDEKNDVTLEADPAKYIPLAETVSYGWSDIDKSESELMEVDTRDRRGGVARGGVTGSKRADIAPGRDLSDAYMSGDIGGSTYAEDGYMGFIGSDESIRSGALTAGEINDFAKWELWQDMTKEQLKSFSTGWGIEPVGRYALSLKSQSGLPLADAVVNLLAGTEVLYTARTDNTGKAELWLTLSGVKEDHGKISMEIDYRGQKSTIRNARIFDRTINNHMMEVDECEQTNNVDIAFVVDATGSMGDELAYLKEELNDIVFKSKQIDDKLNLRFASVFYRDQGDEYVTRVSDFTRVLSESVQFIGQQYAGGGGDYEEAVETGLDSAINSLSWSEEARTRILFLILDAPPHNNGKNRDKLRKLTIQAAEKGIRIIPVGASGINKQTEYLMRSMAIATNGTYTFLTNHSGIGNSHIEPTTDEYEVETFNDILVRIMKSYTYMPDCQQNIPDLELNYPDSVVTVANDSLLVADSLASNYDSIMREHHHTWVLPEVQWSYYPNPTQGILNVTADVGIDELYLTDLSGKLMQSIQRLEADRVYQFDMTDYVTGIYLIRYLHKDRWISGKVILQR